MFDKIKSGKRPSALTAAMLAGAAIALLTSGFTGFAEECEAVPFEVMRLHILANSDSDEDQALKYELRDYLLSYSDIFSGCETLEEAEARAAAALPEIERLAGEFTKEKGYDYAVNVELAEMYFTTRVYENITMPAGTYKALRVVIGEGAGQNWWCVMFPPLCLPACTGSELYADCGDEECAECAAGFFSDEASALIEAGGGVQVRFAIFEWLQALLAR